MKLFLLGDVSENRNLVLIEDTLLVCVVVFSTTYKMLIKICNIHCIKVRLK